MRKLMLIALLVCVAGCSRDVLPTEPQSAKAPATISVDAQASGRRRAVGPRGGPCVDLSGTWDVKYQGSCRTDIYMATWAFAQRGCSARTPLLPDIPGGT